MHVSDFFSIRVRLSGVGNLSPQFSANLSDVTSNSCSFMHPSCSQGGRSLHKMSPSSSFDADQFVREATITGREIIVASLPDPAYLPGYITNADNYFHRLTTKIPWKDKYWNLIYKLPQQGYHYTISEREKNTNSLLEELIWLVEHLHDAKASEVWCNLYRNGDDHIEFHQDRYGEHLTTLSFGSTRSFLMRHLETRATCEFRLGHGDVYTWSPETDKLFEHSVPPANGVQDVRISVVVWTSTPGTGR